MKTLNNLAKYKDNCEARVQALNEEVHFVLQGHWLAEEGISSASKCFHSHNSRHGSNYVGRQGWEGAQWRSPMYVRYNKNVSIDLYSINII